MSKTEDTKYTTAESLAKLLGLTVRRVQQLRAEGAFVTEETPNGQRYLLAQSLIAYIKFLQNRQGAASLQKRKLEADVRIKESKADIEETKLALLRGDVHPAEHIRTLFSDMITQARAAFMDIPGRCAVDCAAGTAAEAAETIRREVCAALDVMAGLDYDPAKFMEMLKEDGGIIIESDEEGEAPKPKTKRAPRKKRAE